MPLAEGMRLAVRISRLMGKRDGKREHIANNQTRLLRADNATSLNNPVISPTDEYRNSRIPDSRLLVAREPRGQRYRSTRTENSLPERSLIARGSSRRDFPLIDRRVEEERARRTPTEIRRASRSNNASSIRADKGGISRGRPPSRRTRKFEHDALICAN